MPQPNNPTGNILSQPNAAVNTADKLLAQLIGQLVVVVTAITASITTRPS